MRLLANPRCVRPPRQNALQVTHAYTDVTGPSDASKAIFVVYDIFGYFDQTVQGADLLAHSGKYQVFMPDFFGGEPAEMSWMAQGMEGPRGTFFGTTGNPQTAVGKFPSLVEAIQKKYASIKSWGILGVSLASRG
jgi:dienelactone hydrolase